MDCREFKANPQKLEPTKALTRLRPQIYENPHLIEASNLRKPSPEAPILHMRWHSSHRFPRRLSDGFNKAGGGDVTWRFSETAVDTLPVAFKSLSEVITHIMGRRYSFQS